MPGGPGPGELLVTGLPPYNWLVIRAGQLLDTLSQKTPPRLAAALRRIWFRSRHALIKSGGACIWGCCQAEVSRALCSLPGGGGVCPKKIRPHPPALPEDRRLEVYGFHRSWSKDDLRAASHSAALVYAVYRAYDTWRTGGIPGRAPRRLLAQALTEAARGSPTAKIFAPA